MDLGRFGKIEVALDANRAWRDTTFEMEPSKELTGKMLEQLRQGHPSALYGDWRKFFDSVSVLRADELDGRAVYIVKLQKGDVPAIKLSVDARTGDVVKVEQRFIMPAIGTMPVTTINEDFRQAHGMRIPYRQIEINKQTGRMVFEIESVEMNLDLAKDAFIIRSPEERRAVQ